MQEPTLKPRPSSIPYSAQLGDLLDDPSLCMALATYQEGIKGIHYRIMLESTTEDNVAEIGAVMLALKKVDDVMNLFYKKGDLLKSEAAKKQTK
jgi:hypothetical protein